MGVAVAESIRLVCVRYDASAGFRAIMRTKFLCIFELSIGTHGNLVDCQGALNPSVVSSTDRSKMVVSPRLPLLCSCTGDVRNELLISIWRLQISS